MASKVHEVFGCGRPGLADTTIFTAGIECEIEGLHKPCNHAGFQVVNDHSLRNNGMEYVSIPASRQDLVSLFTNLHKNLTFKEGVDPFSIRTSTHVHVNVQSLGMDSARNMVLLYALFEEFFFKMVQPNRRNNIHCVPLTETHMPSYYKKDLATMSGVWHKYTALNLKRVGDLGTMEFRHLHGTGSSEELDNWLKTLENLWMLSQNVSITEATLKDKDTITQWFMSIFSHVPHIAALKSVLFDIIRNNLIDVKFSV